MTSSSRSGDTQRSYRLPNTENTPQLVVFDAPFHLQNKKQCSRQLQGEVPCAGNVVNSSLFINSSLSSLSSTRHACCPQGGGLAAGGVGHGGGGGEGLGGRGQGTFHRPCHLLHYHMVLRPWQKGLRTIKRKGCVKGSPFI